MFDFRLFLGTRMLQQSTAPMKILHGTACSPTGHAFFCPQCADVWARGLFSSGDRILPTYPIVVLCERHMAEKAQKVGVSFTVPGSLIISWDGYWNNLLGRDVFTREIDLHTRYQNLLPPDHGWGRVQYY